MKGVTLILAFAATVFTSSFAYNHESQSDICSKLSSCSSCLSKSYCTWCTTKSTCTKQSCGNSNIIYPKRIRALMSGPRFCPRIVQSERELIFPNGKKQGFVVKLTQIHLYMAFTVWKCKINFNGEESVVSAVLISDEVYCDPVLLKHEADKPAEGSAAVLWDNNKAFDGSLLFKVSV